MKKCPTCNRTFPDDTLAFCLADGSLLSAAYDPNATLVLASATSLIPPAAPTQAYPPQTAPTAPSSRKGNPALRYLLIAVIAFLGGSALMAVIFFAARSFFTDDTPTNTRTISRSSPTPTPSPSTPRYKTRSDFSTDADYTAYMKGALTNGMRVRALSTYYQVSKGWTGTYYKTADTTDPPCFVIWDERINTTGVTIPPEAPAGKEGYGYWVFWYNLEIIE